MTAPSPTVLLDLAERCERATGPDRELDALIWRAAFAPEGSYVERSRFNGEWCIYLGVDRKGEAALWNYRKRRPQPVTASIDAAMTLVPEGDPWTLGQNIHHRYWLASINEFGPDQEIRSRGQGNSNHAPALALCAAALRARSTDTVESK